MANIMDIGEDFLNKTLECFASEVVEYRKNGISQSKSVNAVIGSTFFSSIDVSGFDVKVRSIDFIISVNDLAQEPVKGDIIVRNGQLYEVNSPTNEPCWRYSGNLNSMYRIHTHVLGNDEYHPLEI